MMFIYQIPLDEVTISPRRKSKSPIISEHSYWENGSESLKDLHCPNNCKPNELFKGLVYIGCRGCMSYFSEQDIIDANGGLI